LIVNGEIMYENLQKAGLGEGWLLSELTKNQISSPDAVLSAGTDNEGILQIELKNNTIPG
jgi:uncharacterized membrane protein YcaP (DUF421 family)